MFLRLTLVKGRHRATIRVWIRLVIYHVRVLRLVYQWDYYSGKSEDRVRRVLGPSVSITRRCMLICALIALSRLHESIVNVSFTLKNTGGIAGHEV